MALAISACQRSEPPEHLEETLAKIAERLDRLEQDVAKLAAGKRPTVAATQQGAAQPSAPNEIDLGHPPMRGASQPLVTVVEYADFQCPFSARAASLPAELAATYPDEVAVVFRHFPVNSHPQARDAAKAAWAAHQQGKFWEMYDLLFANQEALDPDRLSDYAGRIGLDMDRFKADMASDAAEVAVTYDKQSGNWAGVKSTPTFIFYATPVRGAPPNKKAAFDRSLNQPRKNQAPGGDVQPRG
jgi:protein-disulfide isomerase